MDVRTVVNEILPGFQDDLLEFIVSAVEDMTIEEKKSIQSIQELISPFLLDTGYVSTEDEAAVKCKEISLRFGGSGYKNVAATASHNVPVLLAAPVKLIDNSGLKAPSKVSYGATFMASSSDTSSALSVNSNTQFDVSAIPTTQKQFRKMKRENEQLQRMLEQEAREREEEARITAEARMAAIKASRSLGRQSLTGVSVDKFTLPHPSGQGDLLTDSSLSLSPGRRYGLVGKNGAGKSTLLRALAHYKIDGLTHLRIMLVDQHVEGDDKTPLEWVLNADIERTSLLQDEALLSSHLFGTNTSPLPEELKGVNLDIALQECYERMDLIGVATAETRARKILTGLGFDDSTISKPTNKLSGGWAMRAALASAVFVKPHLLLLDEPTNHLDLHALVWLEAWITNYFNGIALIVSHDRFFLEGVCTDILELRSQLAGQKSNSLTHFAMNYESFEHELEERKLVQARARVAFEKERDKLKEFISREGRKYDNPQHQSQRKMKMKQLENLMEVEEVEEEAELVITLPKPHGYFGDDIALISASDVDYGYENEKLLFEKVQFRVEARSRIAVLGKNGCGKTTLLQLLIGDLAPTKGSIVRHPGCRVAMLQQHHYRGEQLDPSLNPLEHMRRMPQDDTTAVGVQDMGTRQEETAHRSYLANFGVHGWRATIPVKHLSGGQRMRVAMAVALYRRPDIIILDEPTNHLDRDTVRALAEALEKFEGAIVVVSHDEDFVSRVMASKIKTKKAASLTDSLGGELWVMSKGSLQRFDGSFKDYKKIIVKKLSIADDF